MSTVRYGRDSALSSGDGFGRMLLVSLGLHLAVAVVFLAGLVPQGERELRPVYTIDLTTLPVNDPQAGRPDGRPPRAEKEPEPAPQPEAPPEPEAPKPQLRPAPPPEPAAVSKPEPKAKPAKEPPIPKPQAAEKPAESYQDALKAIEKLRQEQHRRQEAEDLSRTLAALKARDTRASGGSSAPLGLPTARGTEAGVDEATWIEEYIKQSWSLSKYQVGSRRDLEAEVRLAYDPQGRLVDYTFLRPSKDPAFDESVRRAILKGKQLPFKPGRRLEVTAAFNLKDLMD